MGGRGKLAQVKIENRKGQTEKDVVFPNVGYVQVNTHKPRRRSCHHLKKLYCDTQAWTERFLQRDNVLTSFLDFLHLTLNHCRPAGGSAAPAKFRWKGWVFINGDSIRRGSIFNQLSATKRRKVFCVENPFVSCEQKGCDTEG